MRAVLKTHQRLQAKRACRQCFEMNRPLLCDVALVVTINYCCSIILSASP